MLARTGRKEGDDGSAAHRPTIRNPAEPDRFWKGFFRVDIGATDSLLPRRRPEAIGLKPKGRRVRRSVGGADIAMDVTTGDIEFMGEVVGGTILLGAAALASAGVEVHPHDRRPRRQGRICPPSGAQASRPHRA